MAQLYTECSPLAHPALCCAGVPSGGERGGHVRHAGQAGVRPPRHLLPALRRFGPWGAWAEASEAASESESPARLALLCQPSFVMAPLPMQCNMPTLLPPTHSTLAGGLREQHVWHPGRGRGQRLLLPEERGRRTRAAHPHQVGRRAGPGLAGWLAGGGLAGGQADPRQVGVPFTACLLPAGRSLWCCGQLCS